MYEIGAFLRLSINNIMNEYETTLTKIYRCSIEDTGNDIRIFKPFSIPMLPDEPIVYTTEPEIAIKFSESSMKDFLRDYEQWMKDC